MFKNKTLLGILSVITLIAFLIFLSAWNFYNAAVRYEENVIRQWANVESAYQRRADLIPNLVETVKGYAKHERETLEAVINARASATQVKIDPAHITPEQLQQFQQAQNRLSSVLKSLLVTVERYPDLKADQHFRELQSQLEGTENRIKVERDRFNQAVQAYNQHVRTFPNRIWASLFGFQPKTYFQSEQGAEKAPEVKF
ncbi:MAG: LemA family protein [Chlorobi bacterium]|nr:LemA family protein [Chlorobiota bacterium]